MVALPQDVFDALNDLDFNPKETRETNVQFDKEFKDQKKETTAIEEQVIQKQEERIKDPNLSSKEKKLYRQIGKTFFSASKSVIMKIRQNSIFKDMMAVKDKVMDSWIVKTPLNAAKRVVTSSIFKKAMKIIGLFSLIWLLLQTFFDDVIDKIVEKISPYIHVAMENYVTPLINALGNMYKSFESFVLYCIGIEEGEKNLLNQVKEYFDTTRSDYDEKNNHSLLGVIYKAIHSIIYDDLNIFGIKNKTDQERDEVQSHIVNFKKEANRLVNTKVENLQEEINEKRAKEAATAFQSKDVQEMLKLTVVNAGWKIDGTKIIIEGKQYDTRTQGLEIAEKFKQFLLDSTQDLDIVTENPELRTFGEVDPYKVMNSIKNSLGMKEGDISAAKNSGRGFHTEDKENYKNREPFIKALTNQDTGWFGISDSEARTISRGIQALMEVERHKRSSENENDNITRFLDSKRRVMGNAYLLENTIAGRNKITDYMLDEVSTRDKTLYSSLASLRKIMEGFFLGGGSSGINSFVTTAFVNLYTKLVDKLGIGDVKNSITGVQTIHGKDTKITDTADKENIKLWEMGMEVGYEMEPTGSVLNLITIDTTNHRPLQNALFLFNQHNTILSQEVQSTNEELMNTVSVFKTATDFVKTNRGIRASSDITVVESRRKQRLIRIITKIKNNEKLSEEDKQIVDNRTVEQLEEEIKVIENRKPTMTDLSNEWLSYLIYKLKNNKEFSDDERTILGSRTLEMLEQEFENRGLTELKYIEERNIVIPVLPPKSHLVIDGTAISLAASISTPDT